MALFILSLVVTVVLFALLFFTLLGLKRECERKHLESCSCHEVEPTNNDEEAG